MPGIKKSNGVVGMNMFPYLRTLVNVLKERQEELNASRTARKSKRTGSYTPMVDKNDNDEGVEDDEEDEEEEEEEEDEEDEEEEDDEEEEEEDDDEDEDEEEEEEEEDDEEEEAMGTSQKNRPQTPFEKKKSGWKGWRLKSPYSKKKTRRTTTTLSPRAPLEMHPAVVEAAAVVQGKSKSVVQVLGHCSNTAVFLFSSSRSK
jgi:flagellar biosynthesis GTPase FlhF